MNTSNNLLKPVKIVVTEKIRDFTNENLKGLESALKMITDVDIKLTPNDPYLMPIETYVQAYKKKSILLKIFAEQAFHGEIYWFFELKTAVLLGGYLRMMSPDARREKIKNEIFDAADEDSFGEVGNQLSGILDRIFRNMTTKKIHLRLDFDKKVYPDQALTASSFVNKEEYVVMVTTITFPEDGSQKLALLLPRSLFEVMLTMELQLEGITPKKILLYSWDKEFSQKMQIKYNTRSTKVVLAQEPDEILHLAKSINPAAIAMGLDSMPLPLAHNDSIFLKRVATNDALQKIPFIFTSKGMRAEDLGLFHTMGIKQASDIELQSCFEQWVDGIVGV